MAAFGRRRAAFAVILCAASRAPFVSSPESLLKTALIDGVSIASIDSTIIGNLLLDHVGADEVRRQTLVIGIRNEAGEIYRIIGADKLASYMNAVEELTDLELVDELLDASTAPDGYDSIFRGA